MRRLLAKVTTSVFTVAIVAASIVVAGQPASAGPPRHQPPDLVAIGDSFAAGTGNTPYSDDACGRSKYVAYAKLLEQLRLVTLQAFPACSGATTQTVESQGQLDRITKDTDVVTVQAFGNDVGFSTLAGICLRSDCSLTGDNAATVQQILASVPVLAQQNLDPFYQKIRAKVDAKNPHARVLVVDYGNPFPAAGARIGFFCQGILTPGETEVAQLFADGINNQLAKAAATYDFTYINAAPRFRGLDICGFASAFFRPPSPDPTISVPGISPNDPIRGALHPNKLGQGIYAAVLAGRLYS